MAEQKSIPQGKLRRGGIVGATAARVGVKKATRLSKRPFLCEERQRKADEETDLQIAQLIFEALSVLRGTALKAAQLISMETELLPEVYRRELAKAASEVPPMNRALVRKVITSELGAPEEVFAAFSVTPFAAASLGQVHAATSHDGKELAVKVQYPGIAAGVESDVSMLKTLLKPTKYARIFASCFDEIRRKVGEELDYRQEARNTEWFGEQVSDDQLIVPEVAPQLTTRSVLATSRIEGLHLEAWLATSPSRALRDHYGQLLVDFFHRCVHDLGVIHADPNPGNFFFRDDGRLGVIDFGCVKRLEPDFVRAIDRLMHTGEGSDPQLLEELHNSVGIFYREGVDRDLLAAFLQEWAEWLTVPYRHARYDFSQSDDFFARGAHFTRELYRFVDRYDGSFIYYGRTEHGLLRMLQRLGARVTMRPATGRRKEAQP